MSDEGLVSYCDRNGAHYIGDAEECWRCDMMAQMQAEEQVFSAARDAALLTNSIHRS